MNSSKKHVPFQSPSRQAADDASPLDRQAGPLPRKHPVDEDDMPDIGEWSGDPRFADFPDLWAAPGGMSGPRDHEMTDDVDEWTGDPRFADFPVPSEDHGGDGIEDTDLAVQRPHLRIVSVEMFNAVQAMRTFKPRGSHA